MLLLGFCLGYVCYCMGSSRFLPEFCLNSIWILFIYCQLTVWVLPCFFLGSAWFCWVLHGFCLGFAWVLLSAAKFLSGFYFDSVWFLSALPQFLPGFCRYVDLRGFCLGWVTGMADIFATALFLHRLWKNRSSVLVPKNGLSVNS